METIDILMNCIIRYNSHNKLKTSGFGGINVMTKGYNTTYKVRIEIIEHCIENDNNYAETSEKYKLSYQQGYSWIKKYQTKGIEALQDWRGKCKKTRLGKKEAILSQIRNKSICIVIQEIHDEKSFSITELCKFDGITRSESISG